MMCFVLILGVCQLITLIRISLDFVLSVITLQNPLTLMDRVARGNYDCQNKNIQYSFLIKSDSGPGSEENEKHAYFMRCYVIFLK